MIFHIVTEENWFQEKSHAFYRPNSLARDNYIHCSFEDQILRVAETLYRGREDILLLCIDETKLEKILRVEDLFNLNEKYPHLYGSLPTNTIEKVVKLEINKKGDFVKPNLKSISSLKVKHGEWT